MHTHNIVYLFKKNKKRIPLNECKTQKSMIHQNQISLHFNNYLTIRDISKQNIIALHKLFANTPKQNLTEYINYLPNP